MHCSVATFTKVQQLGQSQSQGLWVLGDWVSARVIEVLSAFCSHLQKFAIGQVLLAFIYAPTGNGFSFFRTATRSGFEKFIPDYKPDFLPDFLPDC